MSKKVFVIRSHPGTYSYVGETYSSVCDFGSVISIPCKDINEYHRSDYLFTIIKDRVAIDDMVIILSAGMINENREFPEIIQYGYASEKRSSYISSTVLLFRMKEYVQLVGTSKLSVFSTKKPEYFPNIVFTWNMEALRTLNFTERSFFEQMLLTTSFHSSLKANSPDYVPLHKRGSLHSTGVIYNTLANSSPENELFSSHIITKRSRSLPESPMIPKILPTHDCVYYFYLMEGIMKAKEKEKLIQKIRDKTRSSYYRTWCDYQLADITKKIPEDLSSKRREPEHRIALLLHTKNSIYLSEYEACFLMPIQRHRFRELLGYRYSITSLVNHKNPEIIERMLFENKYKNVISRESLINLQKGYTRLRPWIKSAFLMCGATHLKCTKKFIIYSYSIYGQKWSILLDMDLKVVKMDVVYEEPSSSSFYSIQKGILSLNDKIIYNSSFYDFAGFEVFCSYIHDHQEKNKDYVLIRCCESGVYRIIDVFNYNIVHISSPFFLRIHGKPSSIVCMETISLIATTEGFLYYFN